MKQLFSLALAAGVALASLPLAAAQSRPPSAPQEAQAPVPAAAYRSAFAGYRPAAEDDATPDQTWRAVNEKVGKAGGHMGMMKMDGHKMEGHKMEGHKMPMEKPGPKPAAQPAPQHQHEGH
ncbi:hypothetical protein D9M09_16875 [Janthinobacterium agaricidamnosum]|uniref:Copper resistance protein CopB n=1 Tax=Janthinobacterium agaricidamnosum TaxID=55508 RepID=A0A3G2EAH4_9BURK|nr:hypothetical protein [Janthinobacterium agaricidamnosum]AYM77281.1 hypothetical protein D9M09_16875 [Janthinobacterium agaricidamnosum]